MLVKDILRKISQKFENLRGGVLSKKIARKNSRSATLLKGKINIFEFF